MNNRLIIEIGYSNIKILNNNEINILEANIKNLNNIFKKYNDKNIYVLSNNIFFKNIIDKYKTEFNCFIFDKHKWFHTFKLPSYIPKNEIGEDLVFILDYLLNLNEPNILLVSAGTCLVCVNKQNNIINKLTINLGLNEQLKVINTKFKWNVPNQFQDSFVPTTAEIVNYSLTVLVDGLISQIINTKDQYNLVFCGNGFDDNWIKYLLKKYQPINVDNNLVLHLFEKWIITNNL